MIKAYNIDEIPNIIWQQLFNTYHTKGGPLDQLNDLLIDLDTLKKAIASSKKLIVWGQSGQLTDIRSLPKGHTDIERKLIILELSSFYETVVEVTISYDDLTITIKELSDEEKAL